MKRLFFFLLLASCARAPLEDPKGAFRLSTGPELKDSLPLSSLKEALERNLVAFSTSTTIPAEYQFGERIVSREDYQKSLAALAPELESMDRFQSFVRMNFDFYEVYGNEDGWGTIFSTGYYDPTVQGSKKKTDRFSRAIYKTPSDLVSIDLGAYAEKFPDQEIWQKARTEQKSPTPLWRGRYVAESKKIIPYYSRKEIEADLPLKGKGLELAWLDPVDAFFLEIQGSGVVEFTKGKKIRVGYDGQNGYAYAPIGKYMLDAIPLELMSMQRIRQHLNSLSPEARDSILFQNPSYVFFRELAGLSLTYSGAEVTPGRTIATDKFLFPKGTLNYLEIETPVFSDGEAFDPSDWITTPRWVFDQDTGGAIRGGGRVDLYMGQSEEAERMAGVMKRTGKLWALVPKEEFLQRLRMEGK